MHQTYQRNAIILAAGLSARFVPLSLEKPKALLPVHGEILIERQIRQLREAGIAQIVVVTGYKKELFAYLAEKFDVILVENPWFSMRNNHSSLYAAREYLHNTLICSSDNYFPENIFRTFSDAPCYCAVYQSGETGEYCLTTDEHDRITAVTVGGHDAFVMLGPVLFTEEVSQKMRLLLEDAMKTEASRDLYWEDLYIEHLKEIALFIHRCKPDEIIEFDSLEELRRFDPSYLTDAGCAILRRICRELHCAEAELTDFLPLRADGQVNGFTCLLRGKERKTFYL